MNDPAPTRTPQHRSVAAREGLLLLALLPGLGASLWATPGTDAFLARLGLALGFAIVLEGVMQRWRGVPSQRLTEGLAALPIALLVVVLLPPTAPLWSLLLALSVALLLGRHAYGGQGQQLFHPVAFGLAVVLWLLPLPAPASALPRALAWAAGGLLLIALRARPWPVPLAVLGAALLPGLWAAMVAGGDWHGVLNPLTQPTLLLLAFFLASDPASGCASPRGRWLFGAGVGLLAMSLPVGAGTPAAVAALLLMNAAAPLLDAGLRRRPGAAALPP